MRPSSICTHALGNEVKSILKRIHWNNSVPKIYSSDRIYIIIYNSPIFDLGLFLPHRMFHVCMYLSPLAQNCYAIIISLKVEYLMKTQTEIQIEAVPTDLSATI